MEFIFECMAIAAKGMLGCVFISVGFIVISVAYGTFAITMEKIWNSWLRR